MTTDRTHETSETERRTARHPLPDTPATKQVIAELCVSTTETADLGEMVAELRTPGSTSIVRSAQAVRNMAADRLTAQQREIEGLKSIINSPELHDFSRGVALEAAHQRLRWGADHDVGKTSWDWFWLVGYLAQKAASAEVSGDTEKACHHTISTAAALANWHAALTGADTSMRPGINPEERGVHV